MKEQEIAEILTNENPSFKQLREEHQELEKRLTDLESKPYLSAEDEIEIKAIKKQKLAKKDQMAAMIREYKKTAAVN
ncbi:MAG: DUF465 domain-containing protein [Nitrospirae bacterium]|nr:MAG: DUF465 domain-containing protein [Nitrospirota bacterium]